MDKWLKDLFKVDKPVIAMVHMRALPGDPGYDPDKGLDWIYELARKDLLALQEGGVDAVMFSNEFSLPYLTEVEPITTASMAALIAQLKIDLHIPFGVNVLWDPIASIDLAVATGASFVREIFTGVYGSDFGLWNTNCGEVIRHQVAVNGQDVRLFFNIVPESAAYLGSRDIADIARSTVFNTQPDAICVSGLTAGTETSTQTLQIVKDAIPDTYVFANTGVNVDNVADQLAVADGAIIGTAFKEEGSTWNPVSQKRVEELMGKIQDIRN
ncbi:MAG: BtpA/SgcQ family protein [Anaerolineales bacterium]